MEGDSIKKSASEVIRSTHGLLKEFLNERAVTVL